LTDFQHSFTLRYSRKFVIKTIVKDITIFQTRSYITFGI